MTTALPSQGNNISPPLTPESQTVSTTESVSRYRAITHALALTTFVLPFFILPYLLNRRRILSTRRQVDELTTTTQALQHDLNRISSELAVQKDGRRRLETSLYHTMREIDDLRAQAEQTEKSRTTSDGDVRNDIKRLIDKMQHTQTQAATLRALGMSLADVAAFMHKVELEMGMDHGKDHHGIEKLRNLALKMENLAQQDKNSEEKLVNDSASQRP